MISTDYVLIAFHDEDTEIASEIRHELEKVGVSVWFESDHTTPPDQSRARLYDTAMRARGALILLKEDSTKLDGEFGFLVQAIWQRLANEDKGALQLVMGGPPGCSIPVSEFEAFPLVELTEPRRSAILKIVSIFVKAFQLDEDGSLRNSDLDKSLGGASSAHEKEPLLPGSVGTLFGEDDIDIYVNKGTGEASIFHCPTLEDKISRLEYHNEIDRVGVILVDGRCLDLGVKIQWLIRPLFRQAQSVFIVQTKDGEAITGIKVPMTRVGPEPKPKIGARKQSTRKQGARSKIIQLWTKFRRLR